MRGNGQKTLDFGCGANRMRDAVGIDIDQNSDADIIHDLNVYPYPIETDTFEKIIANHIIEHLDDPRAFMREIYRILRPGGRAYFETPHFTSRAAYSEPEHKNYFSYFMFTNLLNGIDFKVIEQEITFYKSFRIFGIAFLANKFPDKYERFYAYMFPAENVKLVVEK